MGDPEELLAALRSLRATRFFSNAPVDDALVDELIDVARWTGSARNRQPWRVVVVRDAAVRAELAGLGAYAAHLGGAPVVLLLAADLDAGGRDAELDLGRFAQTLMLAAHARGLGSCPATFFPDENVERAARLVGLTPPLRARTAIGLGWPAPASHPRGARSAIPRGRLPLDAIRLRGPGDG